MLKPSAKAPAKPAAPEPKRPDLRVIQTDRLPKPNFKAPPADPIPELIQDDPIADQAPDEVVAEEVTTEVEALVDADSNMNVEPEYVDEEAAADGRRPRPVRVLRPGL